MKRFSTISSALVAAGAAIVALAGCSATGAASASTPVGDRLTPLAASTFSAGAPGSDAQVITTTGTGKVSGTPDVMTISLGVQTEAATAREALDQNNFIAAGVIDTLKNSGIQPADLQTSQLSVYPAYDDKNVITGYQVTNSVTAKLRDISTAGAVIDAVTSQAGDAARVQQLSFSIDDDSALRAAARAGAVTQAQAQAEQLAEAAGVPLGSIRSITETAYGAPQPYYAMSSAASAGSVPIEAGSQELSVVVQVEYNIGS